MKRGHNKKRNTAFLYEVLVRELTKSVLKKQEKRKRLITAIIKEHFSKGSLLYKELKQYKEIYECDGLDEKITNRLVSVVVEANKKIDKKQLFIEQSKIISRINRELGSETLQNFIPNFKSLASIYQLFNAEISSKERVLLESKVIKGIVGIKEEKEIKPISNLVYKTFIDKFNKSYSDKLLSEQKELLNKYISSFDDSKSELKVFLNEEIGRLKESINKSLNLKEVKEDQNMIEKASEVLQILEGFSRKPIDQEDLTKIMKIQQLAKEINS